MNLRGFPHSGFWFRLFPLALLGSALVIFSLLVAAPMAGAAVTGVTVSLTNMKTVVSGDAVYAKAVVQGAGDYDHRVTWSLSPANAGSLGPTGLFISGTAFTGTATIKAASVENPKINGTADVIVSAGSDAKHVDLNNTTGIYDGSMLHPYQTISDALNNIQNGDTVKVAQGTYGENVNWAPNSYLLLGGFKGGTTANYAANIPGDFVTRSTDHLSQVTTIQSPSRANPVVSMGYDLPPASMTYAVDGFTLTGGFSGVYAQGRNQGEFQNDCIISQNLITNNGPETPVTYDRGGGIRSENAPNALVLNNQITNNTTDWGGGCYIATDANTFLVQGNIIENNVASGGLGGGGGQFEGTAGVFTWNIIRNNRAGNLVDYGRAGGIITGSTTGSQVELSHNVYAGNQAKDGGGAIYLEAGTAILRHELLYSNTIKSPYSGGAVHLYTNTAATLDHCTISGNSAGDPTLTGGLYVRETATAQVSNSIIWGNVGNQIYVLDGGTLTMTYSDSQQYAGAGNISTDPLFADPATDDYHLKSTRGRWNPATSQWVKDAVYSPCIDAGNPASPFALEPPPNDARTNMGAYGNTSEASLSKRNLMGGIIFDLLMAN